MFDGKAFAADILAGVRAHVDKMCGPLLARLEAVESRAAVVGPPGPPGERGLPGEAAEPVSAALLAEAVRAYLEANPPPAGPPGKDGRDGIDGAHGEKGVDGRDGVDGKDGSPGEPGRDGERGLAGRDGIDGKDAAQMVSFLKNADGMLMVTLSDGRVIDTGIRDGLDGKDGSPGPAGRDGFQLEDFDSEIRDGGRFLTLKFEAGDITHTVEHQLDVVLDRGGFLEGKTYLPGDGVTFGGEFYIAQAQTAAKPDASDDWRKAVRRGRDGRNGKDGERGVEGKQGPPGLNGRGV